MGTIRAGIYVRISDSDETPETSASEDAARLDNGVKRQEKDCRAVAASKGWEVVALYRDEDLSAWSGKRRPEFRRMLDDIEAGELDAVIIWHLDRLSRHMRDLEDFIDTCTKAGTKVATATGDLDIGTSDGLAMARIITTIARKASDDTSRRVKAANRHRRRKGLPVHLNASKVRPFGYEFDYRTIREDEAKLIRKAADDIKTGTATLSGIARRWASMGVLTARGGSEWSYQAVKRILTAPRIAGLMEEGGAVLLDDAGNPVRAQWEGILDEETWRQVVAKLSDKGRRTNHVQGQGRRYLLTGGLAVCGNCGDTLKARPREGGVYAGSDARCYGCRSGKGCGLRHRADWLEDFLRDAIVARLDSGKVDDLLRGETEEAKREREALAALDDVVAKLEALDDARFVQGVLPQGRYLRAQAKLVAHQSDLEKELAAIQSRGAVATLPRGAERIRQSWNSADMQWRQAMVRALVERVIVHPAPRRGLNAFDPSRVEVVWR